MDDIYLDNLLVIFQLRKDYGTCGNLNIFRRGNGIIVNWVSSYMQTLNLIECNIEYSEFSFDLIESSIITIKKNSDDIHYLLFDVPFANYNITFHVSGECLQTLMDSLQKLIQIKVIQQSTDSSYKILKNRTATLNNLITIFSYIVHRNYCTRMETHIKQKFDRNAYTLDEIRNLITNEGKIENFDELWPNR